MLSVLNASRARRTAAVLCALAIGATSGVVALGATGATTAAPAGASLLPGPTTTTTLPRTTTTKPGGTTATTKPGSTTTSSTPSTTVPSKTQITGVPKVPVGGPPTTTIPKGSKGKASKPAPAPNAQPILTAVDQDLAQLEAISDYKPAQAQVTAAQAQVTAAGAGLLAAQRTQAIAEYAQAVDESRMAHADSELRDLAIAAYTGVGFASPAAGIQGQPGQQLSTVSSPEGLTGITALDANEDLILLGQKAHDDVSSSTKVVKLVNKQLTDDHKAYLTAQSKVATAEASLIATQQTLKLVTEAATTPGAADAISLPTFSGSGAGSGSGSASAGKKASPTTTTTSTTVASLTAALETASTSNPATTAPSPEILGSSVMTGADLAAWFASTGHKANITVPMAQLAQDYQNWGKKTGVQDDLAFAQSIIETGYFSFPSGGQLTGKDNNYAGIGACDSCTHGWSFANASNGVGAQLELLEAYATPAKVDTTLVGPVGVGGCCQTWMALAGVWASSEVYGISIMTVYNQMLTWVIPQRLQKAGLTTPSSGSTDSQGPSLAPLPGGANAGGAKAGGAKAGAPTTTVPRGTSAASLKPKS